MDPWRHQPGSLPTWISTIIAHLWGTGNSWLSWLYQQLSVGKPGSAASLFVFVGALIIGQEPRFRGLIFACHVDPEIQDG